MGVYPFFASVLQEESAVTGGCAGVAWLVVSKFSIDELNELMLPIPGTISAHGWESSRLACRSSNQLERTRSVPPRSTRKQTPFTEEKKKKIKREKPW